ncbi:ester cyclase [Mucilaginibacter sp.]|uniref:ester cyclase n=1 Tax=Mucilaginibacter sp. TaxID=1882438 RepID=UPI003D0CEB4A
MSKLENIELQKQFGAAVNNSDWDKLYTLVSPTNIDHDPAPGQAEGPEGYINFFKMMKSAFPDMKIEVEHLVADEDNVSFAYRVTGTHKGEFMGIAATGQTINARGMQISKFKDGKMVERWGSSDELGILKELGLKF